MAYILKLLLLGAPGSKANSGIHLMLPLVFFKYFWNIPFRFCLFCEYDVKASAIGPQFMLEKVILRVE